MSVRLFVVVVLCGACSTSIPQPEPPDPPVGQFNVHSRIEGVDLEAPEIRAREKRMRLRIRGEHTTEELITRFVSRARLAGGIAVSDLAIDAVILSKRRFYRCTANVLAKREERLVRGTRTIPASVEHKVRTLVVIGDDRDGALIRPIWLIEEIEHPEEVVAYRQWRAGLQLEFSNQQCQTVTNLDEQTPNVVAGRVFFAE